MSNVLIDIDPNSKDIAKLQKRLDDYIEQAESYRASWEADHDDYLNSYFTRPPTDFKTDPWPGASNTYLPLNRVGIDGLQAQFYDSLLSQLPFISVRGLADADANVSEDLSLYYDFYLTKQINFRQYGGNFIFDLLLDGTALGKSRVNREEMLRRRLLETRGRPTGLQRLLPNLTLFGAQLPGLGGGQAQGPWVGFEVGWGSCEVGVDLLG